MMAGSRVIAIACLVFMAAGSRRPSFHDQTDAPCRPPLPLTLEDVQTFLKDSSAESVILKVNSCGVTTIPDADQIKRLRAAGATDDLLAILRGPEKPSTGDPWVPPTDKRQMVWIPKGTFQIGSPKSEKGDPDEIQGSVDIEKGFWLDDTEVTKEAYHRFVMDNPQWQKGRGDRSLHDANYLKDWPGNATFPPGEDRLPVVNVSWFAAKAYAEWAGKRLPTEAEWEYAARAGTSTAYWWGDQFDAGHANDGDRVLPVAASAAQKNPWGLYDMLGNVNEWTSSAYHPDLYRHDDGREDPKAPGERTFRGGAYRDAPAFLRSANRNMLPPAATDDRLGFRCAR
jgi:formylglycine-generating enzyme required for sulfatase activity